ncbi:MAG: hypothetical protein ACKO37_04640 [Vampirovibrionales bacterium]
MMVLYAHKQVHHMGDDSTNVSRTYTMPSASRSRAYVWQAWGYVGWIRQRVAQLLGWIGLGLLGVGVFTLGHTAWRMMVTFPPLSSQSSLTHPYPQASSDGVTETSTPSFWASWGSQAWAANPKKKSKEDIDKQLDDYHKTLKVLEQRIAEHSFFTGEDQYHLMELIPLLKALPDELGTDEPRVPLLLYRLVQVLKARDEALEAWECLEVLATKYPKSSMLKRYQYEQKKLESQMKDPLVPSSLR